MTGKKLEIISQIVLWYENSFRIDCWWCEQCMPFTQLWMALTFTLFQ